MGHCTDRVHTVYCAMYTEHYTLYTPLNRFSLQCLQKKFCKSITRRVSDDQDSEKTVDLESFVLVNHNKGFPNSAGTGLDSLAF